MRFVAIFLMLVLSKTTGSLNAQDSFLEQFQNLKIGEDVPKIFASNYFNVDTSDQGKYFELEVVDLPKVKNKNIKFLIYAEIFPVVIEKILVSFSDNGKTIGSLKIGEKIKEFDPSVLVYTEYSYKILDDSLLEICYDEFSFDDKYTPRKYYQYYKIESTGNFTSLSVDTTVYTSRKYPESSFRLLRSKDVSNKTRNELRLMRNEIYAIHGYEFKSIELKKYFESFNWYDPIKGDISDRLTDIEKININYILAREKILSKNN